MFWENSSEVKEVSCVPQQRSSTLLPKIGTNLVLGIIKKSTVLRWAGFHFRYPVLRPNS